MIYMLCPRVPQVPVLSGTIHVNSAGRPFSGTTACVDPRRLSRDEDDDDDDDGSYGDHDYRQDLGGGEDDHNHNSCNDVQCSVWRWLDSVISALGC